MRGFFRMGDTMVYRLTTRERSWRATIGTAASILLVPLFFTLPGAALAAKNFTFDLVTAKAEKLVQKPYNPTEGVVPKFLLDISYDNWRDIRFKPAKALWKDEDAPFTAQFFHPGLYFGRKVTINVVEATKGVRKIPFSTDLFEYEKTAAPLKKKITSDLGFAGFRLHYPINTATYRDEVIVFLGASYFRAVAQHSNYGLSARGIAINTFAAVPEEFPYFKEFWLVKPAPDAQEMTIYALLEGPSITGAYQFVVKPGTATLVEVKSTLFMRNKVEKLGIAPLTSMFFYGENNNCPPLDDFRPEVHDSDGLQILTGSGEWIWRPLRNPSALLDNWFSVVNPKGFGLLQRDLDFDHYQDLEAHYEKRPGVWITPMGDWGAGSVELIQMPSIREIDDNVNALWVPAQPPEPKQPRSYNYIMSWHFPDDTRPPAGRVVATRTAIGGNIIDGGNRLVRKFIVDFEGAELATIPAEKEITPVVTVDPRAKLLEQQVHKNGITNGWRLVFQVSVESEDLLSKVLKGSEPAVELRAFLKDGEKVLTETWSYAIQP